MLILSNRLQELEHKVGMDSEQERKAALRKAKRKFDSVATKHAESAKKYRALKAEQTALGEEFMRLRTKYATVADEFRDEISLSLAGKKLRLVDVQRLIMSMTDESLGYAVQIRQKPDGVTDIFFSSQAKGNDRGHGHIVIEPDGLVVYAREEWRDKRRGEYLIRNVPN